MYMILYTVVSLISLYDLILLGRVVCSWIPYFHGTAVESFCYSLTEPVLSPIRDFLYRYEWVRRCPIDISVMALFVILQILPSFLFMFF